MKRFFAGLLSFCILLTLLIMPASADTGIIKNGYEFSRVSNKNAAIDPNDGHSIDGLIPGGDRMQSYAWAVTQRGGYIYIGTNYNFLGQQAKTIIGMIGTSGTEVLEIIQGWMQDQVPVAEVGSGAPVLLRIEPESGAVKKLDLPSEMKNADAAFRSAIEFEGVIYMGTWGPGAAGIVKINEDDTVAFSKEPVSISLPNGATLTSSMRACAIYDNKLYFAGIDYQQPNADVAVLAGTSPYALIRLDTKASDQEDPDNWEIVADYNSFEDYAKNDLYYLQGGGSFWDIIKYNEYIYAIIATSEGFVLLKAKPDGSGKITKWDTIITEGGNPDIQAKNKELNAKYTELFNQSQQPQMGNIGFLAFTATPYVYNDKLYIGTFDNAPYAMIQGFSYPLARTIESLNNREAPYASLSDMTRALDATLSSPQHLYMVDENDNITDVTPAAITNEPTTEYIWRMIDHQGDLYMSTFDAATLYQYIAPPSLRPSELLGAYAYGDDEQADAYFYRMEVVIDNLGRLFNLLTDDNYINAVQHLLNQAHDLNGHLRRLFDYNRAAPFSVSALENLTEEAQTAATIEMLRIAEAGLKDVDPTLDTLINKELPKLDDLDNETVEDIKDRLAEADNFDDFMDIISGGQNEVVSAQGVATLAATPREILEMIQAVARFLWDFVDLEGLATYNKLTWTLLTSNPGYDLFVSSDGRKFDLILDDGIDDGFNYGGRTFVVCNNKLYQGTANPFYGAQLWQVNKLSASSTYNVKVNGSFAGANSGAGNYAPGAVVSIDAGSRVGYTFTGWKTSLNGVNLADAKQAKTTFIMPSNDVTVTAGWSNDQIAGGGTTYYTVIFKLDGGTRTGGGVLSQWVASGGAAVAPTVTREGYTFVGWDKPFANVKEHLTVTAKWKANDGTPTNPFVDVSENDWFYDDVLYVYENGLMTGTSTSPMRFSPNENLTRAMIVTILYRIAGEPSVSGQSNPFTDVPAGQWYTNAVIWAANNKIVEGYGDGKFGPNDDITREQLATILDRYATFAKIALPEQRGYPGFSDDAKIAAYAKVSVQRLYKSGLINGKPNNLFDPQGNATRAEAATLFHAFLEL